MPSPRVAEKLCNSCGTCIQVCPMGVLILQDYGVAAVIDKCIGCRACEAQCSQKAIEIQE